MRKLKYDVIPNAHNDSGYVIIVRQRGWFGWYEIGRVVCVEQLTRFLKTYKLYDGSIEFRR